MFYSVSLKNKRVFDMSDRELYLYKKKKAEFAIWKAIAFKMFIVFTAIIAFSILLKSFSTKASDNEHAGMCKYYKTVSVDYNSSVESIAYDNYDADHYSDFEEYLSEIKRINHFSKDSAIMGGEIIYIPYYSEIH